MAAILGKKLGMSQIFTEAGDRIPVTVIQAGPCIVTQVKTRERDGYDALQIGFGDVKERRVDKPMAGHFKKAGVPPQRYLAEVRCNLEEASAWVKAAAAEEKKPKGKQAKAKARAKQKETEAEAPGAEAKEIDEGAPAADESAAVEEPETGAPTAAGGAPRTGDQITVESFDVGAKVKVTGISKGKGFAGVIKRHGFAGGPGSHGAHFHRAPGSVGAAAYPARVFKGLRLPGQMGNKRSTQAGLEVVATEMEQNLLMVKGAVPGASNSLVFIQTC